MDRALWLLSYHRWFPSLVTPMEKEADIPVPRDALDEAKDYLKPALTPRKFKLPSLAVSSKWRKLQGSIHSRNLRQHEFSEHPARLYPSKASDK
jgi:hypothetical protein